MNIDRFSEVKRDQKQHGKKKRLHRCRNNKITHAASWPSWTILQHGFREQLLTRRQCGLPGLLDECRGSLR
jgi:hypothetical protein